MDSSLSTEQVAFRRSVADWARTVVAPGAAERDRHSRWDPTVWDSLAGQGLAGLPIPAEYGGAGGSVIDCCVASEAIGEAGQDGGFSLSLGAHWAIGTVPIWLHGSEEQRAHWLPALCDGSAVGAWASTEPEVGSDAGAVRTSAVRDGSEWVLNGTKTFITNGSIASTCIVLARTGPTPATGCSAFVVETDNPGYRVVRELDKLGCRSSPTAEIELRDCRVPGTALLGPEGQALWRVAFECFDWERSVMLAGVVGAMQGTLDQTVRYAREREQFGRPIGQFQAVAHKLADMKINLEVCRTAVYRAAWLKQTGEPHAVEASVAKALVGKLSVDNALEAVQVHGGYGYLTDFPVERALRDAKLASIGGGTTEVQKTIISRALLGD